MIRSYQRIHRLLGVVFLLASASLLVFSTICYTYRNDWCAALTLWPPWFWAGLGALMVLAGWSKRAKRMVVLVTLLWLLFAVIFADEPAGLTRQFIKLDSSAGITVVTLNCSTGNQPAALEALKHSPDIVLLQETPSRRDVAHATVQVFGRRGGYAYGVDCAVVAEGRVEPIQLRRPLSDFTTAAYVTLPKNRRMLVVSARLMPPLFRTDWWRPGCWREAAAVHRERHEQMRLLAMFVSRHGRRLPVVVGGDFNAPAGDSIFRLLKPMLKDTFSESGRGWGNTVLNDFPVLRFDQVWVSRDLESLAARAVKTTHSDHRVVVVDVRGNRD